MNLANFFKITTLSRNGTSNLKNAVKRGKAALRMSLSYRIFVQSTNLA